MCVCVCVCCGGHRVGFINNGRRASPETSVKEDHLYGVEGMERMEEFKVGEEEKGGTWLDSLMFWKAHKH